MAIPSGVPSVLQDRRREPAAGSRRFVSALKTVPKPITTNVMVSEALGASVLGSSGPATSGTNAAEAEHRAVDDPEDHRARGS